MPDFTVDTTLTTPPQLVQQPLPDNYNDGKGTPAPATGDPMSQFIANGNKNLPAWMNPKALRMDVPVKTQLDQTLKYTDPNLGFDPTNANLEDEYANAHPIKTLGNNLLQTGARFLGAATEAIATIPLALNAAIKGDFNKLYDNDITNGIDGWLKSLDTSLPVFQTNYERDHPIMKYLNPLKLTSFSGAIGGAINNLGFMGGAIAGSLLEDAAITAITGGAGLFPAVAGNVNLLTKLGRASRALVAEPEETLALIRAGARTGEETLPAISRADALMEPLSNRGLVRSTGENISGTGLNAEDVIASQKTKELKAAINNNANYYKIRDAAKYNLALLSSGMAIGAFQAADIYHNGVKQLSQEYFNQNGMAPQNEDLAAIIKQSKESANIAMGANVALAYLTGRLNFGSLFKPTTQAFDEAITGTGSSIARTRVQRTVDATGNINYNLLSKTPETTIGKILLNGEKIAQKAATASIESLQFGAMGTIGEASMDYNLRKYDAKNRGEVVNYMQSFLKGLDNSFNTKEGMANVMMGFVVGALGSPFIHKIMAGKGQLSAKDQMARNVDLLNDSTLRGSMETGIQEAAVQTSLATEHKAAVESQDINTAKNLKFEMLYNWVTSGIKANSYDQRIEELDAVRNLEDKSFQSYWGKPDTAENRQQVNQYLDGLKVKADNIKNNYTKIDRLTKNPYDAKKAKDDYEAYESYKDQLALNLSKSEDYQTRLKSVRDTLTRLSPGLDIQKAVDLTSIGGLRNILRKLDTASQTLAKQLKVATEAGTDKDTLADMEQNHKHLTDLFSELQPLVTGVPTDKGGNVLTNELDGKRFVEVLQKLYQLHTGSSFTSNEYLTQQKRISDGNTIHIEDTHKVKDTDTLAEALQNLQDVYKLSEANLNTQRFYNYLRQGKGANEYITKLKAASLADLQKFTNKDGEIKSPEEIQNEIEEETRFDMGEPVDVEEATKAERDVVEKAAKKTVTGDKLTAEEEQVTTAKPNRFANEVKIQAAIKQKVQDRFGDAGTGKKASGDPIANETTKGVKLTDAFGMLTGDKNNAIKLGSNLYQAIFKSGVNGVFNKLSATYETSTPEEVKYTNIPNTGLYRKTPFSEKITILHDGNPIGILRPQDSLWLDNSGTRSVYDMSAEEYERVTGNAPDTYKGFMDGLRGYQESYNNLKAEMIANPDKQFTYADVNRHFDLNINTGATVQNRFTVQKVGNKFNVVDPKGVIQRTTNNPEDANNWIAANNNKLSRFDTLLKDLNYKPKDTAIISFIDVVEGGKGGQVSRKSTEPVVANADELDPIQLAKLQVFLEQNKAFIRDNVHRYAIIPPINGEYQKKAILFARNADTTSEDRTDYFTQVKNAANGSLTVDKLADASKALNSKYFIANNDRTIKQTFITTKFADNGDMIVSINNPSLKVYKDITIPKEDVQNTKTYGDLMTKLQSQINNESTKDAGLAKLQVDLTEDSLKRQIPDDTKITKLSQLDDVLKVATTPDVFQNYNINFHPKPSEAAPKEAKTPTPPTTPVAPVEPPKSTPEQLRKIQVTKDFNDSLTPKEQAIKAAIAQDRTLANNTQALLKASEATMADLQSYIQKATKYNNDIKGIVTEAPKPVEQKPFTDLKIPEFKDLTKEEEDYLTSSEANELNKNDYPAFKIVQDNAKTIYDQIKQLGKARYDVSAKDRAEGFMGSDFIFPETFENTHFTVSPQIDDAYFFPVIFDTISKKVTELPGFYNEAYTISPSFIDEFYKNNDPRYLLLDAWADEHISLLVGRDQAKVEQKPIEGVEQNDLIDKVIAVRKEGQLEHIKNVENIIADINKPKEELKQLLNKEIPKGVDATYLRSGISEAIKDGRFGEAIRNGDVTPEKAREILKYFNVKESKFKDDFADVEQKNAETLTEQVDNEAPLNADELNFINVLKENKDQIKGAYAAAIKDYLDTEDYRSIIDFAKTQLVDDTKTAKSILGEEGYKAFKKLTGAEDNQSNAGDFFPDIHQPDEQPTEPVKYVSYKEKGADDTIVERYGKLIEDNGFTSEVLDARGNQVTKVTSALKDATKDQFDSQKTHVPDAKYIVGDKVLYGADKKQFTIIDSEQRPRDNGQFDTFYNTEEGVLINEKGIHGLARTTAAVKEFKIRAEHQKRYNVLKRITGQFEKLFPQIKANIGYYDFEAPARFNKGEVEINLGYQDKRYTQAEINAFNTADPMNTPWLKRESVAHEFMHPFIKALEDSNTALHTSLAREIQGNKEIMAHVDKLIKGGTYTEADRTNEALAIYLGKEITKAFDKNGILKPEYVAERKNSLAMRFINWLTDIIDYLRGKKKVPTLSEFVKSANADADTVKETIRKQIKSIDPLNEIYKKDHKSDLNKTINFVKKTLGDALNADGSINEAKYEEGRKALAEKLGIEDATKLDNIIDTVSDFIQQKPNGRFEFIERINERDGVEFDESDLDHIKVYVDPTFGDQLSKPSILKQYGARLTDNKAAEEFTNLVDRNYYKKSNTAPEQEIGVKTLNPLMKLQDVSDYVVKGLADQDVQIKYDPTELQSIDELTAYMDLSSEDAKRIRENIVKRLKQLKDTADVRLNNDILKTNYNVLNRLNLDENDTDFVLKYVQQAAVSINLGWRKFNELRQDLKDPTLTKAKLNRLNKELDVVKQLVSFYDDFSNLYNKYDDEFNTEDIIKFNKATANLQRLRDDMHETAINLATKWFMPYVEQHNKFIVKEGYTDPKYQLTEKQLHDNLKYGTTKDTNFITYNLGATVTSRDPINAVFSNLVADMISVNNVHIINSDRDINGMYEHFIKQKGISNNDTKGQVKYYKENYLRDVDVLTSHYDEATGTYTDRYIKKAALHQEFYFDKYDRDLAIEKEKYAKPRNSEEAIAFEEKLNAWKTERKFGKAEQYRNHEYTKLQNDPYFKLLEKHYNESNEKYGEFKLQYGIIPQKYDTNIIDRLKNYVADVKAGKTTKDKLNIIGDKARLELAGLKKDQTKINLDDTVYRSINSNLNKLKDDKNISFDLHNSITAFVAEATQYGALKEVQYNAENLRMLIEGNTKFSVPPRKIGKEDFEAKIRQPIQLRKAKEKLAELQDLKDKGQPYDVDLYDKLTKKVAEGIKPGSLWDKFAGTVKPSETGRLNEQLRQLINDSFYGESVEEAKLGSISLNKAAHYLSMYTSINNMAFNTVAGVSNVVIGDVQMLIEGHGGKYYNKAELAKAAADYVKNIPNYMADLANPIKSKDTQLSFLLDAIQGEVLDEFGNRVTGNIARRMFNTSSLFMFTSLGEHQIQLTGMKAMLLGKKVTTNAGERISLYDAYVKDSNGRYNLRKDLKDFDENDLQHFTRQLHSVNRSLNGNYSAFNKGTLQRKWYGTLALKFRKYIYEAFRTRYASEHTDYEKNTVETGYLRFFFKDYLLPNFKKLATLQLKGKDISGKDLLPHQKYALRKATMELGIYAGITIVTAAMFGGTAKKDLTPAEKALLLYSLRLRNDLGMYHASIFSEFKQQTQNPTASMTTVMALTKTLQQLFHPNEVYAVDTNGHKKGDSKLAADTKKLIPILSKFPIDLDNKLSYFNLVNQNIQGVARNQNAN